MMMIEKNTNTNRTLRGATRERKSTLRGQKLLFPFAFTTTTVREHHVLYVFTLRHNLAAQQQPTGKRCDAQRRTRTEVYRRQRRRKTSRERTRHENDDAEEENEKDVEGRTRQFPHLAWELCNVREDSMSRDDERETRSLSQISLEMCSDTCLVGRKKTTIRRTLKCAKSCAERTLCTCPCPKCFRCEKNRGNRTGRS